MSIYAIYKCAIKFMTALFNLPAGDVSKKHPT